MNPDLDTLATTVYVTVDDLLIQHPEWVPERPVVGIAPRLSDAELVTLAVIQSLLRYTSEARFLRYAHAHLKPWFPYLPTRSAYNRRLRRCALTMQHIIAWLARDCPSWHDDLWLVDSTPVECGRSRTTQQRSEVGGWAEYGYCASHSRYLWGLRFHLVATPSGLPVAFALAPAKADERDIATEMIAHARLARAGQTLMADKGYRSASFEEDLNEAHMTLIRPATKTEAPRRRPAVPPTLPPDHRVDLPNLQGPTRSRTSRRTHQRRRCGTCPPTDTRPHHRHLAQRNHPTTRPSTLPHRI